MRPELQHFCDPGHSKSLLHFCPNRLPIIRVLGLLSFPIDLPPDRVISSPSSEVAVVVVAGSSSSKATVWRLRRRFRSESKNDGHAPGLMPRPNPPVNRTKLKSKKIEIEIENWNWIEKWRACTGFNAETESSCKQNKIEIEKIEIESKNDGHAPGLMPRPNPPVNRTKLNTSYIYVIW